MSMKYTQKNSQGQPTHLECLVDSVLHACAPEGAVEKALFLEKKHLRVGEKTYDLETFSRIFVHGAGKAAAAMAAGLSHVLGDLIVPGTLVTKYGHALPLKGFSLLESGHPVPDEPGALAGKALLTAAGEAGPRDLVFFLLSGGASALIPCPAAPITLSDKMEATRLLLSCGATIHEINAVRKHLSAIKGGLLARAFAPATVVTLIISDVLGDDLDVIGSGPTAADSSTFTQCLEIIGAYGLEKQIPSRVMERLRAGRRGELPETAPPDDPCLARVQNEIIASNAQAVAGAATKARALGYEPIYLPTLQGDVRDVPPMLAERIGQCRRERPVCLLAGGETTVTVRGTGQGGRNQELALRLALELERRSESHGVDFVCFGTDGTDGPTDAAGGIFYEHAFAQARKKGLHPESFLDNNDSYRFLKEAGCLLMTGPTRTNVMDVLAIFVAGSPGH